MHVLRYGFATCLFLVVGLVVTAQVDKARETEKGKETPKELSRGSVFGGKNLDGWIKDLKSKDPSVRENAIATLKLYGAVAREAIPRLIELAKDNDVSIRVNTAIAMGLIGMDANDLQDGVSALTRLLGDNQAIVRYQAALALSRIGNDARPAVPNLILALKNNPYAKDHSWEIRRAAAAALGTIGQDKQNGPDPKVTTALTSCFGDASAQVRLEAVLSLILLGPPTKPADKLIVERAIQARTKDEDKHVAIWAHMALMRMDKVSEPHLVSIAKFLTNEIPTVRAHVGRAFGTIGPESRSHLPELIDALQKEDDTSAIYWIVFAMVQMGDPAPRALDALKGLQKSRNEGIRQMGLQALEMLLKGKMRPETPATK